MRVIINLLMAAAVAYALIMLFVFLYQPRLVYFPQVERELTATPRAVGLDYEDVTLTAADNVKLHGWWVPARNARGTVLLMHGNAGNISHRLGYLTMFNRLGYSVLLFDYRGYGKSDSRPDEEGTYRDAEAAWLHLTTIRNVAARDIVMVANRWAAASRRGSRSNIRRVRWCSRRHSLRCPIWARRFIRGCPCDCSRASLYNNLARIGKIDAPVLIAHSRDDDMSRLRMAKPFSRRRASRSKCWCSPEDTTRVLFSRGTHGLRPWRAFSIGSQ